MTPSEILALNDRAVQAEAEVKRLRTLLRDLMRLTKATCPPMHPGEPVWVLFRIPNKGSMRERVLATLDRVDAALKGDSKDE